MADIFLNCILGAMNYYFDSAIGNSILSVHCQIMRRKFCRNIGAEKCVNFLYKLNIFMLANFSIYIYIYYENVQRTDKNN